MTKRGEVSIYALLDQGGHVRYVGKAVDPHKRLKRHLYDMNRRRTPVYSWLQELAVAPELLILETCDKDAWVEREKYWISYYRAIGPLLNVAAGGNQPSCSIEVRRQNARKVVQIRRTNHPDAKEVLFIKSSLSLALAKGECSEELRSKIRYGVVVRPGVFGCLAKYFTPEELDLESRFQVR